MLIAVEGIDGAGKNTLVRCVREKLIEHGLTSASFGFPAYGETIFADYADAALHGNLGDTASSAWAMALLFALDRKERREEIVQALSEHDVVILDRYVASNAAYSWARTGSHDIVDWIEHTEFGDFALPRPDLQVSVATSIQLAGQRAKHRESVDVTRSLDTYEADESLQTRTWQAYQDFAEENWVSTWLVIDGGAENAAEKLSDWIVRNQQMGTR